MRPFLLRLFAFVAPFLALFAFPFYVLVKAGELSPLDYDDVLRRQADPKSPVLYGPAYTNVNKPLKVRGMLARKPKVLVVGTSRSMQLRSVLFDEGVSFYNGGGLASRMSHLRQVLKKLPRESQPELLLVGVDQWFFNANTDKNFEPDWDAQVAATTDVLDVTQQSWQKIYADAYAGKFTLGSLDRPLTPSIGLSAIVNDNGFRNDGSFRYGHIIRHPDDLSIEPDRQFAVSLYRARVGSTRFEFADKASPQLLEELARFLDEARARGIRVVGFIPSYAPTVVDFMRGTGKAGIIDDIPNAARPLFESRGFGFFDFTDLRPLGGSDAEFIDGIHASEVAHVRIVRAMLADEAVARLSSAALLDQAASRAKGPLALD